MLGRSETLALHHRQKYNNEVYNTVIRSVCQQLLLRVMVWAGWLLIENKERKLHSLYFPSYTEMLFLQITSQLWNYETMKKAIFLEGPLQKWTITWSWLFHVYVYFFFFFFNKDNCVICFPNTYRRRQPIFQGNLINAFSDAFSSQKQKNFQDWICGRHFQNIFFFEIHYHFFLIQLLAGRKKKSASMYE